MPEIAGRLYVPKLYSVDTSRTAVVDFLERAVRESGGRVVYSSFPAQRVAPVYVGAEDDAGRRYGMLIYPFTTTRRETRNRPGGERRTQIRFGDPERVRDEENPIARDVAGVDVTLVLGVDPEEEFVVGLDPLVYEHLPMGISVYYRDENVAAAEPHGWAVWEREKKDGLRRRTLTLLETLVGFRAHRLLDYVRFEARASALGLDPALRQTLAERHGTPATEPHELETFFGVDADTILDIVDSNFRLGIAVRGGVAEHHLHGQLRRDPAVASVEPIDEDAQPDFRVDLVGGRELLIECKTASRHRYANGDFKVEVQKTRDSGAGRKYRFDQFDVIAACLFGATGLWEFRYCWASQLEGAAEAPERLKPIQRVGSKWAMTLSRLIAEKPS